MDNDARIMVRLPKQLLGLVGEEAQWEHRSQAAMIRILLNEAIRARRALPGSDRTG